MRIREICAPMRRTPHRCATAENLEAAGIEPASHPRVTADQPGRWLSGEPGQKAQVAATALPGAKVDIYSARTRLPAGLSEAELASGYGMHPAEAFALGAVMAGALVVAFGVGPWGCA